MWGSKENIGVAYYVTSGKPSKLFEPHFLMYKNKQINVKNVEEIQGIISILILWLMLSQKQHIYPALLFAVCKCFYI